MLLSHVECLTILKNFLNAQDELVNLVDYQLKRDTSSIGYLGDYYALTLSYCTAAAKTPREQQFFVKALPQQSDEVEKEAIFAKEAWLYETLLGEMQKHSKIKWSPKCYYSRSDLCVLENVKLSGYCGVRATLLSEEQLHQLLRTLAAFHAASLVYEQRSGINIGREFGHRLREFTVAPHIAWFTTGLSAILAVLRSLPQYQSARHREFIDCQLTGILERVYAQVEPSSKYRNVLCHRDLWAGNIFFPVQPQDAVLLVDFQTCRYTPPAIDLCFSLYLNLMPSERRRLETKCIDFYYSRLRQHLEDSGLQTEQLLPKSELLQSYEEFRLFGVVYNAVAATIVKVPPAFVTNEFKYIDRSGIILDYMRENSEFRDAMEKCCVDVMEIAMHDL
ncbi:hypothetical protein KR222_011771 [Zaprionus bogoriensis]|nr:hypothetical protein KR222_011771 [Zaprionus bogoriensis]